MANDCERLYDTDLTDAGWALIAPLLPPARPGGRPRTTNIRAVLNAIFYLLRTGCLGSGNRFHRPVAAERDTIQEAQGTHRVDAAAHGRVLLVSQI
jgi:hypothetical protein